LVVEGLAQCSSDDENILYPKALMARFSTKQITKRCSFTRRSFLRKLDRETCGLEPKAWEALLATRKARETLESAAKYLKTCPEALRKRFGGELVTKTGSFTRRSFLGKLDRETCGIEPKAWEALLATGLRGRPTSDFPFRSKYEPIHELPTPEELQTLD
jgi:hypothetical protein